MRRTFATTLTAGLLLLGCTAAGDDDLLDVRATEDPAPEPPEEPEPDPEPDDPYAVPDEIDEAYVELVINAILEVQSEVLRGALAQEQGENLAPDLVALHFATTTGRQQQLGLEEYQRYIDDPGNRGGLHSDIGDGATGRFEVDYVHHAEPDSCILHVPVTMVASSIVPTTTGWCGLGYLRTKRRDGVGWDSRGDGRRRR
jgi:hypothetical protein